MFDFAQELAREAGEMLVSYFRNPETIGARDKSPRNIVTEADIAVEKHVRARIAAAFPDHAIVGEEMEKKEGTGPRWFIDPLDGTTNFAFGIPHWCVSIGLCDDRGELIGVVHDPLRGEMFSARRGGGAFLNGRPIKIGERDDLDDALVATGFAAMRGDILDEECLVLFERVIVAVRGIRRFGSAALDLAYVACGRFDLFFEDGLSPWDIAAGALLIQEAGGVVAGLDSDPAAPDSASVRRRYFETGALVAGNEPLVRKFLTEFV